jgi:beta-1,4-N-acetylglucosaminyltransferase
VEVDGDGGEKMKICIVSSGGGHLTEALALQSVYRNYEHFYVLNYRMTLPVDMEGKTCFIRHSERDWLFIVNLWEAWRILRKERPQLILSTGAGLAVPFALVGKLFRIPVIFVEISAQVTEPSLTGRIMYYLADRFFYQWKPLERYFPKATYGGLLY